jgi:regulatory protein
MPDEIERALKYAILLLKYRLRSAAEIVVRLKRKEYSADVIDEAVKRLQAYGYIDDKNFARVFINSCRDRGWGSRRTILALKKLGVDRDCYAGIMPSAQDEAQSLQALIEKKSKFYRGKKNAKAKLLRFLINRGFGYDAAMEAIGPTSKDDGTDA